MSACFHGRVHTHIHTGWRNGAVGSAAKGKENGAKSGHDQVSLCFLAHSLRTIGISYRDFRLALFFPTSSSSSSSSPSCASVGRVIQRLLREAKK